MKQIHKDKRSKVILQKYPNFSFCRKSKKVFRGNFGSNVEIGKNHHGNFKIKKDGKAYFFSEAELMRMTEYAKYTIHKGKGVV